MVKSPSSIAISEKELQAAVIDMAHLYGWRVAHFRPAMTSKGQWLTPVAADGAGFPDLVLVGEPGVLFVELKSAKGRLSARQKEWIAALEPHVDMLVWRPADWLDGTIESYLSQKRVT